MLRVSDLHTYYGQIHALKGISLEVNRGEIVTLIGSLLPLTSISPRVTCSTPFD